MIVALFLLIVGSFCLYENEAGVLDWHQEHIGRVSGGDSIAYTHRSFVVGTEAGIIAQINLKSSEIEWRHSVGEGSIVQVVAVGSNSYVLSKPASAADESAAEWTLYGFSNQENLFTRVIERVRLEETFVKLLSKDGSIYAVFSSSVYRFDARHGSLLFNYQTEKGTIGNVLVKDDSVYLLSSISSNLAIIVLDRQGKVLSEFEYPQPQMLGNRIDIVGTTHNFYALFTTSGGPQVTKIGSDKPTPFLSLSKLVGYKCELIAGLSVDRLLLDYFPVKSSASSSVEVFKMGEDLTVSPIHKFESTTNTPFVNFRQIAENIVAFTVVSSVEDAVQSQTVIIEGGALTAVKDSAPFSFGKSGPLAWVSVDYFSRKSVGILPRLIIGTSDSSLHCIKDNARLWTLEESLTETSCSLFVDDESGYLSDSNIGSKETVKIEKSISARIAERMLRHSSQLTAYLSSFPLTSASKDKVAKYGFEKIAVFASKRGKLVAMETLTGKILWERMFPDLLPTSIFLVRRHSTESPSVLTLVATSIAKTHVFQLYLASGENVGGVAELILPSKDMNAVLTSIRQQKTNVDVVALMDNEGSVALYPSDENVVEEFSKPLYYYSSPGKGSNWIEGLVVSNTNNKQKDGLFFQAHRTWRLTLPNNEIIAAISVPDKSPVASLGRVLGDRSVLYKYLNPNVLALITTEKRTDGQPSTLNIYVIDSLSGRILLKHTRKGAGFRSDLIHLKMRENFLVFSYWNDGTDGKCPKQNEITVLELYESLQPDEKSSGVNSSSFRGDLGVAALEQSYVLAQPVSSMGVTTTLAGVTSKEVLVAYKNGMIQGLSRRLLDPRRPTKAPSSSEKEEGLIPYHPALFINYRDVATYFQPVLGVKVIKTLPTNLESTSVILAYGLDIFYTRRMPSKPFDTLSEDFSYVQLILSMIALSMGVYYTGQQVQRKRIAESWS